MYSSDVLSEPICDSPQAHEKTLTSADGGKSCCTSAYIGVAGLPG